MRFLDFRDLGLTSRLSGLGDTIKAVLLADPALRIPAPGAACGACRSPLGVKIKISGPTLQWERGQVSGMSPEEFIYNTEHI